MKKIVKTVITHRTRNHKEYTNTESAWFYAIIILFLFFFSILIFDMFTVLLINWKTNRSLLMAPLKGYKRNKKDDLYA